MAFSGGGGRNRGPQGDINVTPLIDIVLVLLIIFMVMTPAMLKEIVAKVPQKQEENLPQPPGEAPIIVELDGANGLHIGGEPIAPEALAAKVAERLRYDRQKVVFFKIDDQASYGRAVRVMDVCKGAGAQTLAIVTREQADQQR
jgi:biopolymer transport protein ExbD